MWSRSPTLLLLQTRFYCSSLDISTKRAFCMHKPGAQYARIQINAPAAMRPLLLGLEKGHIQIKTPTPAPGTPSNQNIAPLDLARLRLSEQVGPKRGTSNQERIKLTRPWGLGKPFFSPHSSVPRLGLLGKYLTQGLQFPAPPSLPRVCAGTNSPVCRLPWMK